jgi:FkbM family methyltransferase
MPNCVADQAGGEFMNRLLQEAPPVLPEGDVLRMAERFLSPGHPGPKYLLGRNEHSAALLPLVNIDGIVDDFAVELSWRGCPVVRSQAVPMDAIVVNCAMSISPVSAFHRLESQGLRNCINYVDIRRAHPETIPAPAFVSAMQAEIAAHRNHWIALFGRLADSRSRRILCDVLGYRLSADPRCMAGYSVRFSDQYFEDFLRLKEEIFIDAGGYNGDTTEEFCTRYPDYRSVIIFEPSARSMCDARERLAGRRNIEFIEAGLSDAKGTLWFDPDAGSASAIRQDGSCRIDVTTLDDAVDRPVSFIKMDLEGWENRALAGSRGHILSDHPKLAISVYHAASDFWRIPEFILGLRADYEVHLRHYTEGWSETVMFFMPRHRRASND